jgi:hypothetical protein
VVAVKTPAIRVTRRAPSYLRSSTGLSPQLSALTHVADVGAASGVRESQLRPRSSGCGEYLAHLSRKREPTRGLKPLACSLRVITQALQGCAGVCNCRIFRGVSFPCLAACCTIIAFPVVSEWYQERVFSGVRRLGKRGQPPASSSSSA